MAFELASYLLRWDEICRKKFGHSYDFSALEAYFQEHATGKRHITAKDVGKLFNPENTPFAKYWPRPHAKALEEVLTEKRVYVGPLSKDSKALIESASFRVPQSWNGVISPSLRPPFSIRHFQHACDSPSASHAARNG